MFNGFFDILMDNEGGYVNDPNDSGGATNYGISLRFLKSHGIDVDNKIGINEDDIKSLDKEKAKEIYKQFFWNDLYDKITCPPVAYQLFDFGVNAGVKNSVKKLQIAISKQGEPIAIDGIFGPNTLSFTNKLGHNEKGCQVLFGSFQSMCRDYYKSIAKKRKKNKRFLQGWLNRLENNRRVFYG